MCITYMVSAENNSVTQRRSELKSLYVVVMNFCEILPCYLQLKTVLGISIHCYWEVC